MLRTIVRVILSIIAFVAGFELFKMGIPVASSLPFQPPTGLWFPIVGGSVTGLIFYIIIPKLMNYLTLVASWVNQKMKAIPTMDMVLGVVGLLVALIIGLLLSFPLGRIPWAGPYLALAVTLVLSYLGVTFVLNRKDEFNFAGNLFSRRVATKKGETSPKVLDTSVIIDGRIMDICQAGFLEGELVLPSFVLEELRHIADSPDLLKRNRGRRGLDILNKMQKEMGLPITISSRDFDDIAEVDSKLVKLAQVLNAKVITNDFNLNKVCELQGVPVLNINELANAVKPVVLPGEEMNAQIIKDGKEAGQGVAYLEDGTMIVVEGGKKFIGDSIEVLVTSVLQTAAGRMIFAKPKHHES